MKKVRLLLISVLLILFDQWTKYFATLKLKNHTPVDVIPGVFQFAYVENTGSAFGMFGGKTVFLLIFTSLILIAVLFIYFKIPMEKRYLPIRLILMFIVAGAIGNIIDRFAYHYVVDFLYFQLIDFPVFNVADIYITCSAIVLLVLSFFYYKEEDFNRLAGFVTGKKEA